MIIKVKDNHPRIDKYLFKVLDDIPMSLIQKLLRKKKITLNNNKVKPSDKALQDDKILINYKFKKDDKIPKKKKSIKDKIKYLKSIIYQNDDFLIIDKPPNVSVQGGSKVNISLKDIYETLLDIKLYLVHRIDKDTSGLIIFVKSRFVASDFSKLFLEKKINKFYLAITQNKIKKNNNYLSNKNKDGKLMKLRFRFLNKIQNCFVYYVFLITGKKHQIRLQLSLINSPIKNDNKFSSNKNKNNLCLYSFSLSFFYKNIFYNFRLPYEKTLKKFDF
ncbi:MAG: hypothetical protein CMI90_04455 [Pelagibacteraceae bacterium]|nr:hypothetical protein [Pelagibacteraceae bacterium]